MKRSQRHFRFRSGERRQGVKSDAEQPEFQAVK